MSYTGVGNVSAFRHAGLGFSVRLLDIWSCNLRLILQAVDVERKRCASFT